MSAVAGDKGARLVVFPEAAMRFIGSSSDPLDLAAENLDGPFVSCLREIAQKHGIGVIAGMFERAGDDVFNTVVAVEPSGEIGGTYRKIHLFDAFTVKDQATPGSGETLLWPFDGHRLGIMTCYDIRFPELARDLVDKGADVLVCPTAWRHGMLKEDQWRILARARAIENTCWLIGAAQVGGVYSGNSLVVDPMGVVVASLGEEPGVLLAEIDAERTAHVRAKLPALQHRRYRVELVR